MTQLPGTSNLICGIQQEDTPYNVMPEGGWIMGYVEVGDNPEPHPGVDYSAWASRGYGTICRIQYRWGHQAGTLPKPENLDAYVQRVRTCVANSRGIHRWQIGNEPNVPAECPDGWMLTPEYVALCYGRCWNAIHDLPDHEWDEAITPPIGPWNAECGIGWVPYFQRMLEACEFVDAIGLHAYTHGSDPTLVTSEATMNPPYEDCHYHLRCYQDFLKVVPWRFSAGSARTVPVYITETDQYESWLDVANGWIPAAYKEINDWNQSGGQVIRAVFLYRWKHDKWHIDGKPNVIADFQHAQSFGYTWPTEPEPPVEPPALPKITEIYQSFTLKWSDGTFQTFSGILQEEE